MVWWQKVYSEHWLEPGFLDHWRYFLNCQINKCIRTCWKQKPCTHGVWLMDKLNVMQCHFTCNHWAMPKKRPHQWISISMPCVPLLPMLVLGTCPHLDSFYALVKKNKRNQELNPPNIIQFTSTNQNVSQKTNLPRDTISTVGQNSKSGLKISQQNLENVWKCRIKYNLFILLQRSQKKITQIPLMSFPGLCLNARTDNLPSASMTWQRNHSQPLRAPEWMISSSRSLGLFLSGELFVWHKFAWHVTTVRAVWVGSSAVFRTGDLVG